MFLYARLVLDYISTNIFFNLDEIKTSVNELPEKLSDLQVIQHSSIGPDNAN